MAYDIKLKVEGGTTSDGASLCRRCKFAHWLKFRNGREAVSCTKMEGLIFLPVVSCNKFLDSQHPFLHEMKELAWQLRTDKMGRDIGFVSPEKLKKLQREGKVEDDPAPWDV